MSEYGVTVDEFQKACAYALPTARVKYWHQPYSGFPGFADVTDCIIDDARCLLLLQSVQGEPSMRLDELLSVMEDCPADYEIACRQETGWNETEWVLAEVVEASPEENLVFLQDEA